eukprot:364846-Chlamydomonas_euryale.AAC.7
MTAHQIYEYCNFGIAIQLEGIQRDDVIPIQDGIAALGASAILILQQLSKYIAQRLARQCPLQMDDDLAGILDALDIDPWVESTLGKLDAVGACDESTDDEDCNGDGEGSVAAAGAAAGPSSGGDLMLAAAAAVGAEGACLRLDATKEDTTQVQPQPIVLAAGPPATSQDPDKSQQSQVSQGLEGPQDSQESQDLEDSRDSQESQGLEDSQESMDLTESQDPQDHDDSQTAQESHQESQKSQEPQYSEGQCSSLDAYLRHLSGEAADPSAFCDQYLADSSGLYVSEEGYRKILGALRTMYPDIFVDGDVSGSGGSPRCRKTGNKRSLKHDMFCLHGVSPGQAMTRMAAFFIAVKLVEQHLPEGMSMSMDLLEAGENDSASQRASKVHVNKTIWFAATLIHLPWLLNSECHAVQSQGNTGPSEDLAEFIYWNGKVPPLWGSIESLVLPQLRDLQRARLEDATIGLDAIMQKLCCIDCHINSSAHELHAARAMRASLRREVIEPSERKRRRNTGSGNAKHVHGMDNVQLQTIRQAVGSLDLESACKMYPLHNIDGVPDVLEDIGETDPDEEDDDERDHDSYDKSNDDDNFVEYLPCKWHEVLRYIDSFVTKLQDSTDIPIALQPKLVDVVTSNGVYIAMQWLDNHVGAAWEVEVRFLVEELQDQLSMLECYLHLPPQRWRMCVCSCVRPVAGERC